MEQFNQLLTIYLTAIGAGFVIMSTVSLMALALRPMIIRLRQAIEAV